MRGPSGAPRVPAATTGGETDGKGARCPSRPISVPCVPFVGGVLSTDVTVIGDRSHPHSLQALQDSQDLVQQVDDAGDRTTAATTRIVEQARHGAQQVAEEVARTLLGGDIQVNRV